MTDTADTRPIAIVHRTPGLLDLRSLTVMGLSAKPNAGGHPIGQFGTGLKYAVATLLRLGAKLTIFIGEDEFVFQPVAGSFRGSEFTGLKFRRRRGGVWGKSTQLPFTTEYGKYWQPWMAFRELHSNTLDEGGETTGVTEDMIDDWGGGRWTCGQKDHTTIVVELDAYTEAWLDRDTVFLPQAQRKAEPGTLIEVLPGESEHVYFRGLRVLTLPKRATHTYNILTHVALTEDRTLYGDFQLRDLLGQTVRASHDEALIEPVLVADETYWEHNLEHPKTAGMVTTAFLNVVSRNQARVTPSAFGLYAMSTPRASRVETPWERAARPWSYEAEAGEQGRVLDAKGRVLFLEPVGEYGDNSLTWAQLAQNMVACVNDHADRDLAEKIMYSKRDALPAPVGGPVATAGGVGYRELLDDDIPF